MKLGSRGPDIPFSCRSMSENSRGCQSSVVCDYRIVFHELHRTSEAILQEETLMFIGSILVYRTTGRSPLLLMHWRFLRCVSGIRSPIRMSQCVEIRLSPSVQRTASLSRVLEHHSRSQKRGWTSVPNRAPSLWLWPASPSSVVAALVLIKIQTDVRVNRVFLSPKC